MAEFAGRMWLHRVFRLTLLFNPELGGTSRETRATPGVTAGPGTSLRFLEETRPPPGSGLTGYSPNTAARVHVFSGLHWHRRPKKHIFYPGTEKVLRDVGL